MSTTKATVRGMFTLDNLPMPCGSTVNLLRLEGPPDGELARMADTLLTESDLGNEHSALTRWNNAADIVTPEMILILHGGTEQNPRYEQCAELRAERGNERWTVEYVKPQIVGEVIDNELQWEFTNEKEEVTA